MQTIDSLDAATKLSGLIDSICSQNSRVGVRNENDNTVVLISLREFQSLAETAYLLGHPRNALRLVEAIVAFEATTGSDEKT